MSVRSGQSVTRVFTTRTASTGAATNADSTPTGTLYLNGTANGATVTVTNVTTGVYKAAVTMPTLAIGDAVDLRISATVASVADNAVIWQDVCDLALSSAGAADAQVKGVDDGAITQASMTSDALADKNVYDVTGRILGNSTSAFGGVGVQANVAQIAGSASAATAQKAAALAVYSGTVGSATTTTITDSGLVSTQSNNYTGRVVIFTSGTLLYQAARIASFNPSTDTLTLDAADTLTTSPTAGDTYCIV
jgi:hypothetical protein